MLLGKKISTLCLSAVLSWPFLSARQTDGVSLPDSCETQTLALEVFAPDTTVTLLETVRFDPRDIAPDTAATLNFSRLYTPCRGKPSIYQLPYSRNLNVPDWHRLWTNTAIFAAAFGGTLAVLECLPEGATNWNRASIQSVPPFRRWYNNVIKKGPEWDGDNPIFNYVLHPYAGAVYFMSARSAGFSFWRSFLYSAIISNVGWEYGIEGFMERPSIQDLIITPCVGSVLGECFYKLKRRIVADRYHLWGSPVLGNIVAFLIDPVNEVVGLFGHSTSRHIYRSDEVSRPKVTSSLMPAVVGGAPGFSFVCQF